MRRLMFLALGSCVAGCKSRETPPPARADASGASHVSTPPSGPAAFGSAAVRPEPIVPAWRETRALRVCADPNNLPFSNREEKGFENRLARMIARDLGDTVQYIWWPQRRGFIRQTLKRQHCDVVLGVPADYDMTATTAPYYRSTYVFVSRRDRGPSIASFDDTALRHVRIGIHTMGDDYANSPAEVALAKRGIRQNVVGYSIYGDYTKPDPPADLVRAVARGDIDVAVVWGPLAGYFAKRSAVPLTVTPVQDGPSTAAPSPFRYDIAAGIRRGDTATKAMLERELRQHQHDIQQLLRMYGVPLVPLTPLDAGVMPPADPHAAPAARSTVTATHAATRTDGRRI